MSSYAQLLDQPGDVHHLLIENKGQWPKNVLFQSQQSGGSVWIQQHKLIYHIKDFSEVLPKHHGGKEMENGKTKETLVPCSIFEFTQSR